MLRLSLLPPPAKAALSGEFRLGTVVYGGHSQGTLHLTRENLNKHDGIFSITGGEKTNIGINLLIQLQQSGIPFLVVDWKRSYRHVQAISGQGDIEVYSVGRASQTPFNWNPLRGRSAIVQALRDACVGELERAHQHWLLLAYAPTWESRVALATEWLAQLGDTDALFAPWELAEALPDLIEQTCAQTRLIASFGERMRFGQKNYPIT